MPKTKQPPASSSSSAKGQVAGPESEQYPHRLWTVTKTGDLMMPVATPPAGKDECFGPFWDVKACGDRGGKPANVVRDI